MIIFESLLTTFKWASIFEAAVINFINVKRTIFLYERRFFMHMSLEKSCRKDVSYEKFVRLMLMKLTPGVVAQIALSLKPNYHN